MDIPLALICMVAPLPLFFFYLMAKDLWEKKKRKDKLVQFLRTWKIGNPILRDVEKLIIGLNGFFPWDRPLAIRRIVKMGSRGTDVVIAALDMPYCWTWTWGFEITSQEFTEACGDYFANAHQYLVRILGKIGSVYFEKLRDALQHPNRNVRLSALSALGMTKNSLAVELLVPFLDSTDVEERIGAVVALGELRAKSVVEKVIPLLKDWNPVARERAVAALVEFNDVKALPALDVLRSDHTVYDERCSQTMADLADWAVKKIRKSNKVG